MPKNLLEVIEGEKTGLILEIPKITDFVAGLETGIVYEELNPSGKWGPYYPTKERQSNIYTDFLCCTSGSHTNNRETRFNYKVRHKLYPDYVLKFLKEKGYIDANGNVNFSERFLAKLAETDKNKGAQFTTVAEIAKNYGLVPESAWPIKENMTWEEFYADIPPEVFKLGEEFLEIFQLLYEWVDNNFALIDDPLGPETTKALKQAPLQVAIGLPGFHALQMGEAIIKRRTEKIELFDTYPPFIYTANKSYKIHYSMKLVEVVRAPKPKPAKPEFTFTRTLRFGMTGPDVKGLQQVLAYEGFYDLAIDTYFGTRTKAGLQKWQLAHDLQADGVAGPKTNEKLNEIYSTLKKKALE